MAMPEKARYETRVDDIGIVFNFISRTSTILIRARDQQRQRYTDIEININTDKTSINHYGAYKYDPLLSPMSTDIRCRRVIVCARDVHGHLVFRIYYKYPDASRSKKVTDQMAADNELEVVYDINLPRHAKILSNADIFDILFNIFGARLRFASSSTVSKFWSKKFKIPLNTIDSRESFLKRFIDQIIEY